jgi:3-deoxy-D-manno-octulosonic-acid transferase
LITLLLFIYDLAWRCAIPLLKRSDRVSLGWLQRTLQEKKKGPYDIWIQAASGGESMLTTMVLNELPCYLPEKTRLRVLVTSGTKQGVDSLYKGLPSPPVPTNTGSTLDVDVAYFPFDAPHIMKKAFALFHPKLAIIVETELWPGFLSEAKKNSVPVLLINGRMSDKSFRSYRHLQFFFKRLSPERILTISELDSSRFSTVMVKNVEVVDNIKFDRIDTTKNVTTANPVQSILPGGKPFLLLGSIRREEENLLVSTICDLLNENSDIVIGLFPKHIERADRWIEKLSAQGIDAIKRSQLQSAEHGFRVVVWDVFGELAGAYALAKATFVGGSLVNLGGQNFLEPLVFGLRPIIGPYWKNFAWVGRDILTSRLVVEVETNDHLTKALLESLHEDEDRKKTIEQVRHYFDPKKGGTRKTCQIIAEELSDIIS